MSHSRANDVFKTLERSDGSQPSDRLPPLRHLSFDCGQPNVISSGQAQPCLIGDHLPATKNNPAKNTNRHLLKAPAPSHRMLLCLQKN